MKLTQELVTNLKEHGVGEQTSDRLPVVRYDIQFGGPETRIPQRRCERLTLTYQRVQAPVKRKTDS